MKKAIFIVAIAVFVLVAVVLSTAVDTSMENSVKVSGTVESISEGGIKDMVFKLENDSTLYYINRGFENGFNLAKAKKDFEGKKIKLFYAKSSSPLALESCSRHITHAAINDSVIFSEW